MNRAMQTQAKITEPTVPLRRQTQRRRVWPTSKLCKGGPSAPAFGGYGLDRACCTASAGPADYPIYAIPHNDQAAPRHHALCNCMDPFRQW